jgi:dTDP-4-dehydrorhamnose 3,5-epimerase
MNVLGTSIPDIVVLAPRVFDDERGFFFESWNAREFRAADVSFVQDNHSRSKRGVLRGLHYQIEQPQGKLVHVVRGEVFDVCVDLRKSSPTFGRWIGIEVSEHNHRHVWVPPGFAHGFLVRSEWADVAYKVTNYYAPAHERCLIWNDPDLAITWPLEGAPLLAAKDRAGARLRDAETFP